jgi:PAS domain S-box-containing protein
MLQRTLRLVLQSGMAVVAIAAAALVGRLLDTSLGAIQIALLYAAVAVAVWYGGAVPALLATALGGVAAAVLFTGSSGASQQLAGLLGYLLSCSITVALGHARRVARRDSFAGLAACRRTEEALRACERDFRSVFELAAVGAAQVDPVTGQFVRVNQRMCEITGYSEDELLEMTFFEITHPHDRMQEDEFHSLMGSDEPGPWQSEKRYVRRDGSIVWVLVTARFINDSEGRPVRTAAHVLDVTARKQAEQELRRSEARYRALVEATTSVVWTWYPDSGLGEHGKVQAWWQELTGQPPDEQMGTGWLAFVHPDDRERATAAWLTAMTAGSAYDTEYRVRTRTGEYRHLLSRAVPVHETEDASREWVGMLVDITEHRRVEEALKEADRRKDEFLATLAHELRNPLAPIRSSLQLLKMPAADPAVHERAREMMERQLHHLVRLVDDLLDVSRIMRGKIELRTDVVAVESVIARALESVQHLIDAQRHTLVVSLPAEPVTLTADPVRLAQVVGNLLTNAAKYTEPGGHIRLAVERSGSDVLIRVSDTGIGIAPHMQSRIFEPFVQVDHSTARAQGGLGIGLTLVKSLVEMHHGSVEARSAGLGQGTEMIVRLPAGPAPGPAPGQAAPAPGHGDEPHPGHGDEPHPGHGDEVDRRDEIAPEAPAGHPPAAGGRILVVDDNTDAGETLAMLLSLYGYQAEVVGSGMAALELIPSFRPGVVFLDIGMPVMDGYEVARRLRELPAGQQVYLVAVTGWGQPEDRRRTQEAGFDHHLIKPVDPGAVRELLAQVFERRRAEGAGRN